MWLDSTVQVVSREVSDSAKRTVFAPRAAFDERRTGAEQYLFQAQCHQTKESSDATFEHELFPAGVAIPSCPVCPVRHCSGAD